ncbi:hypothetical protein HK096_002766 [Nowakowskiella sp. JEL0078]|nr:hypothetical protein HK096_002766 [Nowakowskiella sp. JEL0078]
MSNFSVVKLGLEVTVCAWAITSCVYDETFEAKPPTTLPTFREERLSPVAVARALANHSLDITSTVGCVCVTCLVWFDWRNLGFSTSCLVLSGIFSALFGFLLEAAGPAIFRLDHSNDIYSAFLKINRIDTLFHIHRIFEF